MLRKQLEIPPGAKAFIRDMKAFFRTKDLHKRDEIAARQSWLLQQHLPRGAKLRTGQVKELFQQMKEHVDGRV